MVQASYCQAVARTAFTWGPSACGVSLQSLFLENQLQTFLKARLKLFLVLSRQVFASVIYPIQSCAAFQTPTAIFFNSDSSCGIKTTSSIHCCCYCLKLHRALF